MTILHKLVSYECLKCAVKCEYSTASIWCVFACKSVYLVVLMP